MRAVFGLLSLLIGLAVVGVLLRQQLKASSSIALPVIATSASGIGIALPTSGTPAQQSRQIKQQFKQALDQAIQARPLPKDAQ